MAILPIDIQALLVRMDSVSKTQQMQQDKLTVTQILKGGELSELAQIESSRVNQVKPHQNGNSKIEDEQKKEKKSRVPKRSKRETGGKKRGLGNFKEPYKGTLIDTER